MTAKNTPLPNVTFEGAGETIVSSRYSSTASLIKRITRIADLCVETETELVVSWDGFRRTLTANELGGNRPALLMAIESLLQRKGEPEAFFPSSFIKQDDDLNWYDLYRHAQNEEFFEIRPVTSAPDIDPTTTYYQLRGASDITLKRTTIDFTRPTKHLHSDIIDLVNSYHRYMTTSGKDIIDVQTVASRLLWSLLCEQLMFHAVQQLPLDIPALYNTVAADTILLGKRSGNTDLQATPPTFDNLLPVEQDSIKIFVNMTYVRAGRVSSEEPDFF